MSAINNYRETGPEDYLNAERRARASNKAGNTSQNNTTIHGVLPADSSATVTTLAQVDADTIEATTRSNVATVATLTGYTDPFEWYISEASIPATPIKWEFFDWRIP